MNTTWRFETEFSALAKAQTEDELKRDPRPRRGRNGSALSLRTTHRRQRWLRISPRARPRNYPASERTSTDAAAPAGFRSTRSSGTAANPPLQQASVKQRPTPEACRQPSSVNCPSRDEVL